jgi:hypothetical protein
LNYFKYPIYLAFIIIISLIGYSLIFEKPRQYRAKQKNDSMFIKDSPRESSNEEPGVTLNEKEIDFPIKKILQEDKLTKVLSDNGQKITQSVAVAFSDNDAGGKIVLTLKKCDKLSGLVAYTTSPAESKVSFGCWTNDELFILINWDKEGIISYGFDRFFDTTSHQKLNFKYLSNLAKDNFSTQSELTKNKSVTSSKVSSSEN